MSPHEFPIDLQTNLEGLGTVLVTDLSALLMAPPDDNPDLFRHLPYDVSCFHRVMDLGNVAYSNTGYSSRWFVATSLPVAEVARRLHSMWDYYARFCNAMSGLDLDVEYWLAPNSFNPIGYGFTDAPGRGLVRVYGGEYWRQFDPSGDPDMADWSTFLRAELDLAVTAAVPLAELEAVLAAGVMTGSTDERLVVVRPSNQDSGFTARGFILKT